MDKFKWLVDLVKGITIGKLAMLLYMFFIGYKLVAGEFIIPQDYYLIGLITFTLILAFAYDIVKLVLKNIKEKNESKENTKKIR